MGGFRFINGHPGQPPVRPNMSLGDSLAGLHAALGVLLGLVAKNKLSQNQVERTGQVVDVAIYESMLNMMESVVPEYDRFNQVS
jgi:crotonobetainyl-CoA:carnitine CoA-transferase CaiB-like acyl-CoA transferase